MAFVKKPKDDEERAQIIERLASWKTLDGYLMNMSETQLRKAMHVEFNTKGRRFIIERLKSRFNVLRNEREKKYIDNNVWR